jgi:energy-coupling factor transport system permease protein
MLLFRTHRANTVIHRLHPFTKVFVSGLSTLCSVVLFDWRALLLMVLFLVLLLAAARIPVRFATAMAVIVLLAIMTALNYAAARQWSIAFGYTLRITVFMTAIPLCAATTAPADLSRALSRLPLPHGVIVAFMIVWRFFPVMAAEVGELRKAAALRATARRRTPAGVYRGFLVPLSFLLLEYSERVALSLELRGFSPNAKRSSLREPAFGATDITVISAALCCAAAASCIQWGLFPW